MYIQLRYNYRLDPTPSQLIALARALGCARVVFNDGLRIRQAAYAAGLPHMTDTTLQKQVITAAKHTSRRRWLSEVSSVVLVQALADLNTAYRNFFSSVSGKRKGPKIAPPKFRSRKDNRQSIRLTRNGFRLRPDGKLNIAKIGDIAVRWSRSLPSTPSSVTVVKDASGRYFASFVVQVSEEPLPTKISEVGVDLGLTHFAVFSDGTKVTAPKFLRQAERKLKRLQQNLSRKAKGSANRKKAVVKVARAHSHTAAARRDFHHKLSTRLIRDNQAVYVEDLCVKGLGRTRLAKSVFDAGWSRFVAMLEYKAARFGRNFAKVDRAFPSSQLCCACGLSDGPKPLTVRSWTCQGCDTTHDRDINAARNIKHEARRMVAAGRAETRNACGGLVSPAA